MTALALIPGAGMWVPSRYSASTTAVNRIFLRISATRNALRIVEIIAQLLAALGSDSISWQVPPAASIAPARRALKPCA